jgi:hypothetical protein
MKKVMVKLLTTHHPPVIRMAYRICSLLIERIVQLGRGKAMSHELEQFQHDNDDTYQNDGKACVYDWSLMLFHSPFHMLVSISESYSIV